MTKILYRCLLAYLVTSSGAFAQTVDTIVFGNSGSEENHSMTAYFPPATDITKVAWQNRAAPSDPSTGPASQVVSGGAGLSARRLLPRTPNGDIYGGQVTFTMAVDPLKQNYFTLKMWGSDPYGSAYLLLNCNGKEIGGRHGGNTLSADKLWAGGTGWWINRFFYRTEPLPLAMTRGKTQVTITVRSSGSQFDYAPLFTYVPQYQNIMDSPSESLYSAYTHAGSLADVTGEGQGSAPAVQTPRTVENETTQINALKNNINSRIVGDVTQPAANLSQSEAELLAKIYDAKTNAGASWIVYPSGTTDATIGNLIITVLDNTVTSYAAGSGVEGSEWGGGLAPMGNAIRLAWPLISSSMSESVNYGGTLGTTTRQAGWAKALRGSVDAGRYNRQNIANQAMANGTNIYYANRGLLLVDSTKALDESEAIRYLKEASGMQPWLGNDQKTGGSDGTGGGPVPTKGIAPYGPNWYMCTTRGTTKEDGFVGSDYGEVGPWMYRMGLVSGDADLQARAIAMTRARNVFRYPSTDEKGYLVMMGTDPIGTRNNNLPSHFAYLGSSGADDFLMASQGASAIGDDLLGAFQQLVNDGQVYRYINSSLDPYLPSRWSAIKAMAPTNRKFPMSIGEPDFAWADEENMVVAAKHGEERLYVNLFWRAQAAINGLAKVFHLTPTLARLGDVFIDDVRFRPTGKSFTAGPLVDGFAPPADNPQEAFAGTPLPIAFRSDLATPPASNRDGGRSTGYTFRYGNWLIGVNADYNATYAMKLPSNFSSATDLISNTVKSGPVMLSPKTSAVFYLPDTNDPAPAPTRSLFLEAIGSNGIININWAPVSAATSYNLLRSTVSGSGYTPIATGLTGTSYTDTAVTNGTRYYYVLTATNSAGTGDFSPEAIGTSVPPKTAALPKPWTNVDVGATIANSTASINNGTFTLTSGRGTFGGSGEGFHMVYLPIKGDCVLTAKITSQTNGSSTSARAGIVLRTNLAQNAMMGAIVRQRNGSSAFQYCGGDGGTIASTAGSSIVLPYWVRLVRSSLTLTGYTSPDGVTWTKVGSYNYGYGSLPPTMYAGLMVSHGATSGNPSTATAAFTNVTFPLGSSAAPAAPTSLAITAANAASVNLAWNETPGAASYNIKRGTNAAGPFATIATGVIAPSYGDYGLANGSTYHYVVSAVNSVGESANSSVVSATLMAPPAPLAGLTVSASGTQAALGWIASSGASSYTVSRSTSYNGPYTTVANGVTGTTFTDTNPSASTLYYYTVVPINGAGAGQGSVVSSLGTGLPDGWQTQDVGVNVPGGASESGGTYTLYGNGIAANGQTPFRYAYRTLTGDGTITVRLASQSNQDNDRAGIMIRDSLDESSRYLYLNTRSVPSGFGFNYEYRQTTNGAIAGNDAAGTVPSWMKIVRTGSVYAMFTSTDGQVWSLRGNLSFPMNTTICVGLAVSSGSTSALNTAVFDNFSIAAGLAKGGTASASVGSGSEGAAQAFDGNPSTKLGGGYNAGGWWLQYRLPSAQVVDQYTITSANDVPGRDPASWQLQGSNDGSAWTTLDTQSGQSFPNRFQLNSYAVANTTPYLYYRLFITANAGGSSFGIQLSDLGLLKTNISGAATGGSATASINSLQAFTAFDNDPATKWGGAYAAGGWWLQYQLSSALVVDRYSITSADDVPGGDPAAWQFQGSNDGNTWTTLDTRSGQTFANRLQINGYAATNTTPYLYYRLNMTANAGGSDFGIQVSELRLYAANAGAAFVAPPAPQGLSATWGTGQALLNWQTASGAASYNVKRATISGGPYSTVASSLTNPSYSDTGLTSGTTYYYVVSAVNGGGESVNSAENNVTPYNTPGTPAQLQATSGDRQVTLTWESTISGPSVTSGGTASASSGAAPEGPAQAFDGNTGTKWLISSPTGWLRYQFSGGVSPVVNQYAITSANDVPTRDPSAWQLQGSNDGSTWMTLDTRAGQVFTSRSQTRVYAIANATGYPYYRLNVTANNGGPWLQLSELALFTNRPASYTVKRSLASGGPYSPVGSSSTASYTDLGVSNGTTYYYVVSASNLGGESANSPQASAAPLIPVPTGLSALPASNAVNLSWNTVPGATGYQISRSTTGGAPYSVIASLSSNNYLDSSLANGTTYTYVVATVRSTERSTNSAPVSATPAANFAFWQQQYFTSGQLSDSSISGRNGDANQDGIPNLLAYAFNASPWANITPYLPTTTIDGGYLTITFTRRKAPTDITYTVQVTGDLATWDSGASYTTETEVISLGPDTERVTVQDKVANSTRRFIRVEIEP